MSQARRRRPRDRGATAVEAALVLPLVLLIAFGIIDFGRMLNAQIRVTEAAREAARAVSSATTLKRSRKISAPSEPSSWTVAPTTRTPASG
ncbi:TadE/TadG family type IV pilus assembly protein [Phytohabitans flavus]|uniref:TadE/TadG family type IV pilus assembly protein n=1 Tax=Phytohabitans flavus TaxID=1076124 RepID=UPI00363F16AB